MTTWLHHSPVNRDDRFTSVSHRGVSANPMWRRSISLAVVVSVAAVAVALTLDHFADLSMAGLTIAVVIGGLTVSALQWGCFPGRDGARRSHVDPHDHRQSHVTIHHS